MKRQHLSAIVVLVLTILCGALTGCPEAEQMMAPVIKEPADIEKPAKPTTNGEVKQPDPEEVMKESEPEDPKESVEPEPEPEEVKEPEPEPMPTVTIVGAVQNSNGSVTVSGTSKNIPKGTAVTVTLADRVTAATTTNRRGIWTVRIPATEAEILPVGTATVTVMAMEATDNSSFELEYIPPDPIKLIKEEIVPPLKDLLPPVVREYQPPESNPGDFVGQVRTLYSDDTCPIAEVSVTITAGARSGEQVITDQGGYYLFPNVNTDELYLRVEREHFEPKEVIVHRARPTVLQRPNGPTIERRDVWNTPGIIVIGQRWPDAIRFIFEETVLPSDILFIRDDGWRAPESPPGWYYFSGRLSGIVAISVDRIDGNPLTFFAHEVGHAHQHAIKINHNTRNWSETEEGRAYARARERDLDEVGKSFIDRYIANHYRENLHLVEGAAEFSSSYWGRDTWAAWRRLESVAPNRYRWAEEWLDKQYD